MSILWYGCPSKVEPLPDIAINPAFELAPPLAKDVTLQVLKEPTENGNLLLVADFGKDQIKGEFHALMVGEEKFVLRDDGKDGDEVKGDGRFSIIMDDDLASLTAHLDSLSQRNFLGDGDLNFFEGRLMHHLDRKMLPVFNPKEFLVPGKVFRFPKDLLKLLTPADPLLKPRSLMVTDPGVVGDPTRTFTPCPGGGIGTPNGVWTFGHLIREMANTPATGISPEDFLMKMLQTWQSDQTINGDLVAARTGISSIINTWQQFSGSTLNIDKAPFKLIAIVNRVDLRGSSGYGVSNAGEGRFVFCALNVNCQVMRGPAPFMVIFEYGVPKKGCPSVKAYAQQWFNLKTMVPGTPAYNSALELITRQFTEANLAPGKANGSALNQLRTNEFVFSQDPWELREFVIDNATHHLKPTTVKQEPQVTFNQQHSGRVPGDVQLLATFTNTHEALVKGDRHTIPLTEGGRNMLAGKAHTLDPTNYHWDCNPTSGAPDFITNDTARFKVSLNTCSGCHGGEANTGNFMHVAPSGAPSGLPAQLSGFLTGTPPMSASSFTVSDRALRRPVWEFNDLERRAKDLEDFVAAPCKPKFKIPAIIRVLTEPPLVMTH